MEMTVDEIKSISLSELIERGEFRCSCGKVHRAGVRRVTVESGAVGKLCEVLRELGCGKPFVLSGSASFAAAGGRVCAALEAEGMSYAKYVFPRSPVKPDEKTVGSAIMHFDYSCDCIVSVGSGVINDTGKLLAKATGRRCVIVGTAPSMDGFVSATSSMDRDGLKISLPSTAPSAVIGDLDILCEAPMHMLASGVGDMLAKLISLCEWRLANIIVGEEYCPVIAALVERAVNTVIANADALLLRDKKAVAAVTEGLVLAGIAMNYAGISRPASGMEHYFSHLWDMRSLAFDSAGCDLHGIQAGIGTLYSLRAYELMLERHSCFDREKALAYAKGFSLEAWNGELETFIGEGAQAMIALDRKERKYDLEKHKKRLDIIEAHWNGILAVLRSLPRSEDICVIMKKLGIPTGAEYLGYDGEMLKKTFKMSKDIRDKYVGSRLFWDLGTLDELAEELFG